MKARRLATTAKKCACGAPAMRLKEQCGICECLEASEVPDGNRPACWPMVSRALGLSTDRDLAKAREVDRKAGVPTDYDAKRRPILRDRAHRRAYLRAHGAHDRDGGYGD